MTAAPGATSLADICQPWGTILTPRAFTRTPARAFAPLPRSPPLAQPAIRASNCREAYIRRAACVGSAHNDGQNCLAAECVGFRVPANPDDPAPRRLLIARVEAPLWRPPAGKEIA
jgi:hypothetical protein